MASKKSKWTALAVARSLVADAPRAIEVLNLIVAEKKRAPETMKDLYLSLMLMRSRWKFLMKLQVMSNLLLSTK